MHQPPKVIAEIGACHLGDLDRAQELCRLAKLCGAHYIKTQKRNPEESTPIEMRDKPHPNQIFSYGKTYLDHRKNLELSIEDHAILQQFCSDIGIEYTTSVWDMTSAREVVELRPPFIKIPSACNQHFEMLDYLVAHYDGEIHLSTGMTTADEMKDLLDWIERASIGSRIVFYHCTSKYPCPFEDLHLLEIPKIVELSKRYGFQVGFSNHGKGIAADVAAYILGASWIERHFIDDRTVRHTDAAASLEPRGLSSLVRDLNAVNRALTHRPSELDAEESAQRDKLKYKG